MPRPLPAIDFMIGFAGSLLGVDVSVALGYALWKIIEYAGEALAEERDAGYGEFVVGLAREKARGAIWFVLGLLAGAAARLLLGRA